ncbi:restriction endonuclease subunit S [Sinorhizobium meliloti]|uniref:restriction endonuclease subunit S n=1 Tax=Rhizobium meliloti TaxID=382 RepID=UPI00299DF482
MATVADVCTLQNGRGFKPEDWGDVGLPIIRIQNLNGNPAFNHFAGEVENRFLVEPGQMLFAWAGTKGVSFGPTVWNGKRGVLNQHIFKVHCRGEIDHRWLYATLRHVTDRIERKAHGFKSTLVHVKKAEIERQPILLPPLPEQRKIAEILSTWDKAIETTEKLLANAEAQKEALMQQLLTGKRRLKGFEGGDWSRRPLAEVTTFIRDGTHGTHARHQTGVPMISAVNVTDDHLIDLSNAPLISSDDYAAIHKRYAISPNDILLTIVGTIGRSAIVKTAQKFTAQRSVAIIRASAKIAPTYLASVMASPDFQRQLRKRANVTAQPGVYLGELAKILVPVPTVDEQMAISALLENATKQVFLVRAQVQSLKSAKSALMQQLLSGKRRVPV